MEFILAEMVDKVLTARASLRPLYILGGGTRQFYGEAVPPAPPGGQLEVSAFCGVLNYEPSELVITARAGTPLAEIESLLAEHQQMLAFEPPRFGQASTIGGCVASGLSGPRRMMAGALRDFVLGATLLDAAGSLLRFGGEVMKNVAGYDISRLLTGSMGIFGPLIDVSLKVAPMPPAEQTLLLEIDEAGALQCFNRWRGMPLPISATSWHMEDGIGVLRARLSGAPAALQAVRRKLGGELLGLEQAAAYWDSLRDQTHAFFKSRPLWRMAVPPATPVLGLGDMLIEWNGGLRWLGGPQLDADSVRNTAARHGGHATLFRYEGRPAVPVFHPLAPGVRVITQRLKQELDPTGMFNPGRLFRDF